MSLADEFLDGELTKRLTVLSSTSTWSKPDIGAMKMIASTATDMSDEQNWRRWGEKLLTSIKERHPSR
jgi:hypothetical protein